jgi:hypothetical protein
MNKQKLLNNIKNKTYVRIGISKVDKTGVGVIAIKDIPKDKNPFEYSNKKHGHCSANTKLIDVNKYEMGDFSPGVKKMIIDFFDPDDENNYSIPLYGLNSLDISYYLNTSKTPNLKIYKCSSCKQYCFKTLKKINKNNELLINYDEYNKI